MSAILQAIIKQKRKVTINSNLLKEIWYIFVDLYIKELERMI